MLAHCLRRMISSWHARKFSHICSAEHMDNLLAKYVMCFHLQSLFLISVTQFAEKKLNYV